jgi:2-methylcitrate dehydratase PrpD
MVCQPVDRKRNVASFKEALFSLPYGVASALVRGHVSLEDFTEEAIQDPEVRAVANKVFPYVDPDINAKYGRNLGPQVVEVIMKNGRKRSRRVDFVKGHPQNPMTMEEYEEKFRECVSFSGRPIGEEKVSALIKAVKELDTLDDVSAIVNYLK